MIDFGFYGSTLILFFIPSIYYQYFQAHNTLLLLFKTIVLGGLTALLLSKGMNVSSFSFDTFFPNKTSISEPYVENNFLGIIKDRYNAVNLRNGPGSKNAVVRQIAAGERFLAVKEGDDTWWEVFACDGSKGYMFYNTINILDSMRQSDIDNFMQGTYPCAGKEEAMQPVVPNNNTNTSSNPLPTVNYNGKVGSLKADFHLTQRGNLVLSGEYHYPDRNPNQVYQLKGEVLAEGRILLTEFTNGTKSAECDLTYTKSQRCYVGKMKNTNGKQHDIRICGNEFKHPLPTTLENLNTNSSTIKPKETNKVGSFGVVNGKNVNVRNKPSTQGSRVVTQLQSGEAVEILDKRAAIEKNDALLTRRRTTLITTIGKKITLEKGKAVTFENQEGNKYMVSVDLGESSPAIGLIRAKDLRSANGQDWYRVRFKGGMGWIFGDFISEQE